MNKPKLLLTTLNLDNNYSNLGLLNLKASLLSNDQLENRLSVSCKNYDINLPTGKIIDQIKQIHPDYIGFSTFVWNIDKILEICHKLKKEDNDLTIILGGVYVSPIAKKIIRENPQIDIIIRGEGEMVVQKLFQQLLNNSPELQSIKGITYQKAGQIKSNNGQKPINDLSEIPSPYLKENSQSYKNKIVTVETQRGCPHNCSYCFFPHGLKKTRFFSTERIKKELKHLLDQKISKILISAPSFNTDLEQAKEISKFIAKNNTRNIEIWADINAERVDAELAKLLNKANIHVQVGLQSKYKHVLKNVNRNLNSEKFEQGYSLLKKYNVHILLNLILGLPGATSETFIDSLQYSLELEPDTLWTFKLMVLPGTVLWKKSEKLGLKHKQVPPHTVVETEHLSESEIKDLLNLAYAVKYIHLNFKHQKSSEEKLSMAKEWTDKSEFWKNIENIQLRTLDLKHLEKDFNKTFPHN